MTCARVIRGISSMAKTDSPALASAASAASLPNGSAVASTSAPLAAPASADASGRRTARITSAPLTAAEALASTFAPASV